MNTYHRKLAEICAAAELEIPHSECFFNEQNIDLAAAALADEQVVDPEDHRNVVGELQAEQEAHRYVLDVRDELKQRLAALRAKLAEAERLLNCLPFRPGVNRDRVIAALRAGDNDG